MRLTTVKVAQVRALVLVTIAAVAVGGCSGGSSSSSVSTGASARTIAVSEKDNGHSVHAHIGDTVVVTLHNTYWQLGTPNGAVLMVTDEASPTASTSPCPSIPGTGCGTVTHAYKVTGTGTATLVAHRTSCGEALRCTAGQSAWKVTVVAS